MNSLDNVFRNYGTWSLENEEKMRLKNAESQLHAPHFSMIEGVDNPQKEVHLDERQQKQHVALQQSIFGWSIMQLMVTGKEKKFSGNWKDFLRCLGIFLNDLNVITLFTQSVILIEVWKSLSLDELVGICVLSPLLQIALYGTFLMLITIKPAKQLAQEWRLSQCDVFSPPENTTENKKQFFETYRSYFPVRFFIYMVMLFELTMLVVVSVIGTKFLLGSKTVNSLVKSAVAVAFIKDIDKFVFMVKFSPASTEHIMRYTFYHVNMTSAPDATSAGARHGSSNGFQRIKQFFIAHCEQYAVIAVACAVVLGLRAHWCIEGDQWYR